MDNIYQYIAECNDFDELQDIINDAKDRIKTLEIFLSKDNWQIIYYVI